jgi:hypothetical protein
MGARREVPGCARPGGWSAAVCPPWTPPADGLLRALDGPRAGRRLGDGLGRTGLKSCGLQSTSGPSEKMRAR